MPKSLSFQIKGPSSAQMSKAVESAVEEGLGRLRSMVQGRWETQARSKLDSSVEQYLAGLVVEQQSNGVKATIKGWLPVALEAGAPSFDMKPGLLAGRQSRVIPMHDGEFRTVSKNSPEHSWWHPGFTPYAIHEDIQADADDMVQRAFGPAFDRVKV